MDGITALAAILIASFAIERITKFVLFLLSLTPAGKRFAPDPVELPEGPARLAASRKRDVAYYCIASFLGTVIIAWYGKVRVLNAIGFDGAPPWLDILFTGLLLTAGSDRIAALVKMPDALGAKGTAASHEQPLQITGTLVLQDKQETPLALKSASGS
jgi:hypothetical protein